MTGDRLLYATGRAQEDEIRHHLKACDDAFRPPLSGRTAIPAYAARITAYADRFEAWSGPLLVGLVAAYCNDPERREAFVTSVSVLPGWTGRGIGTRLIRGCIAHAGALRFGRMALEVHRDASAAIRLYRLAGFADGDAVGSCLRMTLELGREAADG